MAKDTNEEDWMTEMDSKYRLVLVAAKRSKQLQRGAKPRVTSLSKKTTRIALEEVERGLVPYMQVGKESDEE